MQAKLPPDGAVTFDGNKAGGQCAKDEMRASECLMVKVERWQIVSSKTKPF